jgi:hypothetical protein
LRICFSPDLSAPGIQRESTDRFEVFVLRTAMVVEFAPRVPSQ